MSNDKHFNANRIFVALLVFTLLEVAWGYFGGARKFDWNKTMLWGGLLFFASLKGWLIAVYFMHLKFEGWVIKSLILPTPFLVMVIMGYIGNDVADGTAPLVHPIGSMMVPDTGVVNENLSHWKPATHEDGDLDHGGESPSAEPVAEEVEH